MSISSELLLGLLIISDFCVACPRPFSKINSLCVFVSITQASWCDAQNECRKIKGELLTGDIALEAMKSGILDPADEKNYWIGASDLSDERKDSRNGWKWTNGSVITSTLLWMTNQPRNNLLYQDCLCIRKKETADFECEKNAYFICQPKNATVRNQQKYKMVDIFVSADVENYARGHCAKTFDETNIIRCAARCLQTEICVSFYFNDTQMKCRMILYTDAQIDLRGSEGNWKKFLLQK